MAKRNGNGKSKTARSKTARRDIPLPSTLPQDLKPYDTNNDGVLSEEERLAMRKTKQKEKIQAMKKDSRMESVKARKKTN